MKAYTFELTCHVTVYAEDEARARQILAEDVHEEEDVSYGSGDIYIARFQEGILTDVFDLEEDREST